MYHSIQALSCKTLYDNIVHNDDLDRPIDFQEESMRFGDVISLRNFKDLVILEKGRSMRGVAPSLKKIKL